MRLIDEIIREYRRGWTPATRFVPPQELPVAIMRADPRLLPPSPKEVVMLLLYPLKGKEGTI